MIAPRYVETNSTILRLREKSLSHHYDKLSRIKTKGSKSIDNSAPFRMNQNSKIKSEAYKNGKKLHDEQAWVERANKLLEGRLKAISERKNKWLEVAKTYTPRSNLESIWRRETKRIQMENEFLAKRLVNPSSDFSVERFREDYRQVQEYKKHLSKDLYLKNRSMRTLEALQTGSSQSLLDIPILDKNSPKHEQRVELMKISESFEKQSGSKNKLKVGGIMRTDYEGCDEEVKKKKRLKRRKMLRKSSLDPLQSDRSHKETSSKPSNHHKNHSKSSKHQHNKLEISQVPAGSPPQPDTSTFESYHSKLDSASPSSSRSPSASET